MKKTKLKKQKSKAQAEEEIFFDFKPCCVKVKRIKVPTKTTEMANANESEGPAPKRFLRNPALALTKRRAQELKLQKTAAQGKEESTPPKQSDQELRIQEKTTKGKENLMQITKQKDQEIVSQKGVTQEEDSADHNAAIVPIMKANNRLRLKRQKQKEGNKNKNDNNEKDDIYDFLSQSQTSSSDSESKKHRDPAADIIKKLIKEGKVTVTKNYKGKPVTVRKKKSQKENNKNINKAKGRALTKNNNTNQLKKQFQPTHDTIIEIDDDDANTYDDFIPPMPVASDYPNGTILNMSSIASTSKNQASFSKLARSVLMQQTNNGNSTRRGISEVSTPLRRAPISLKTVDINLSPIHKTKTPNKNKTLTNTSFESNNFDNDISYAPSLPNEISNNSLKAFRAPQDATRQQNSLSSFSSNDSNVENMPPSSTIQTALNTPNSNREILNARRTLPNRQPLKQLVNIIDVITLPPYTHPINKAKENSRCFGFEEYLEEDQNELHEDENNSINNMLPSVNIQRANNQNSNREILNARRTLPNREHSKALVTDIMELPPYTHPINKTLEDSKLFGFEEYLDEDQNELLEDDGQNNNNNNNTKSSNIPNLRKRLKKLRPMVQRPSESKRSTITKHIFDDDFDLKNGQRDIRNMFCSTMCEKPGNKTITSTAGYSSDSNDSLPTTSRNNHAVDLFGDPESTFDEKSLQRTYERPFKRKRKLLHQYSVFLDSEDESEEEEAPRKNKRKNREKSPEPELEEFVSQFNSMIKEAEDYELIVE